MHKFWQLLFVLLLGGVLPSGIRAQSLPEAAREINKLLQRATGGTFVDFMGSTTTVVRQTFAPGLVTLTVKNEDHELNWEYSQISWGSRFAYSQQPAKGSDKLNSLSLSPVRGMKFQLFRTGQDKGKMNSNTGFLIYFNRSDAASIDHWMKQLGAVTLSPAGHNTGVVKTEASQRRVPTGAAAAISGGGSTGTPKAAGPV